MSSLSGKLLVAVPRPLDETTPTIFTRSVVLVLHHGKDGAQGLVLTCPLEAGVDVVLPGWQKVVSAPDRLFQGGPMKPDTAIALANLPGHDETLGAQRLYGSLALVDLDAPAELVAAELAGMRIFAGSAGWAPGQLDDELGLGSWFVVDAEIGDMFDADPATLWRRILARQPAPLCYVSVYPRDPSLN